MAAIVYQRYLLTASSAANISVPASATFANNLFTIPVPLSSSWTIRCRRVAGLIISQDNSGSLQLEGMRLTWFLLATGGSILFSIDVEADSMLTPSWSLPKAVPAVGALSGDPQQTFSSLDQTGGVVTQVQAAMQVWGLNSDATNPHPFSLQLNAVLEFEAAGSSE